MKLAVAPGKYVVAVSGGVDSVALLDAVRQLPDVKLIVAHFDHGIREDSAEDRRFVQQLAMEYGLPFVFGEGQLGPAASEATARHARYEFLHGVRNAAGGRAVMTAHHQDDVLETAVINLLRGTGRRGLSSLRERDGLSRPLLSITKRQLRAYALSHSLEWREDSTNQDLTYLRNYVRHKVLPRFTIETRRQLTQLINAMATTNQLLDAQLINYLHLQPFSGVLHRGNFIHLPHTVAREVLASWLRHHGLRNFDSKTLERLVVAAKTGRPGMQVDVQQGWILQVDQANLTLQQK